MLYVNESREGEELEVEKSFKSVTMTGTSMGIWRIHVLWVEEQYMDLITESDRLRKQGVK